ncbi:MAG: ArnT family glycosyltransferase [Acidimicrobiales bacterium]
MSRSLRDDPALAGLGFEPAEPQLGLLLRLRSWAWLHRRSFVLLAALLAVIGVVHGVNMGHSPAPIDDEGTYVSEAWAVEAHGTLAPYTYWYDHPPLGWIQLGGWALVTSAFSAASHTVASARSFTLIADLASASMLYVLARRLDYRRPAAAAATLLFTLSPLAVVYQRYVYLDNIAMPWVLAAFALALSPKRRLWAYAGAGACFAIGVLSKETFLLLMPALVWQIWRATKGRTAGFCLTAFFSVTALFGLMYPLYAALRGELVPGKGHVSLIGAVEFQLFQRHASGFFWNPTSVAHQQVMSWLALDPWLVGTGAALLPVAFAVPKLRPISFGLLTGVLVLLRPGYLPWPFIISLLPFAALVIAGLADVAYGRRQARSSTPGWGSPAAGNGARGSVTERPYLLHPRPLGTLAVASVLAVLVLPGWWSKDRYQMTANNTVAFDQAEAWVEGHVPHRQVVAVSNTMWLDLVNHGFAPNRVIWFYKINTSQPTNRPSLARPVVKNWTGVDYIVEGPQIRQALADKAQSTNQAALAVRHSVVVASFGSGGNLTQVRKVVPPRRSRSAAPRPPAPASASGASASGSGGA